MRIEQERVAVSCSILLHGAAACTIGSMTYRHVQSRLFRGCQAA
jgi:hypothetical protein